jgi:hypothetical protein
MAYLINVKFTKPSGVAWNTSSAQLVPLLNELKNKEKEKYKQAGKLILETSDNLDDENTYVYTALWSSREAYEDYTLNPVLTQFWEQQYNYNQTNGITFITETREV